MPYSVRIPRLGLTMEAARVVQWYKQPGESVTRGEPLFSVESDKAVQDIEALATGVFYPLPNLPDEALPIATVIGYILGPGESVPEEVEAGAPSPQVAADETPAVADAQLAATPAAMAPAATAGAPERPLSSPAARRRARELGIDWRTVVRPEGGPILVAHVEQAARSGSPTALAPRTGAAETAIHAGGLIESLSVAADAEALSALFARLEAVAASQKRPAASPTALYARIAAYALAHTPEAAPLGAIELAVAHAGDYGADALTLALDASQAAALAVGRITLRPTRSPAGAPELRPTVDLCLTFDRAVLCREAAGALLAHIRALVEQPYLLLA